MTQPDPRRALVEQMFAGLRDRLERETAGGRRGGPSLEELADAISHPRAPEVIVETLEWEAQSVRGGDPAPDFTLPFLPGSGPGATATLSDHFGERPVALVFGSYT